MIVPAGSQGPPGKTGIMVCLSTLVAISVIVM